MKTIWYRAVLLALVVTAVADISGASAAEKSENANRLATGVEDQAAVALTIYNVNLGLVKDQRQAALPAGTIKLRFMDMTYQIIPASVQVRSLTGPSSLRVLEQNYEYDLLNPQKLLEKYVDKEVKLFVENQYTEREDTLTATLLSIDGGPIFKIGEDISFGHPGRILFPKVPENLTAKPTLVWLLENSLTKPQRIEATYLTNAINWRADYVLTLNARDDRADISGWVTIDNKSGAAYSNATLKLVAGDVNRVRDDQEFRAPIISQRGCRAQDGGTPVQGGGILRIPHLHSATAVHSQKQPDQADQPRHRRPGARQEGTRLFRCAPVLSRPLSAQRASLATVFLFGFPYRRAVSWLTS